MDAMIMNQDYLHEGSRNIYLDEKPNIDIVRCVELLKDSDELLWDDCITHSKLSIIVQVYTMKSNYGLSKTDYDMIL